MLYIVFYICLAALLSSCASVVPPSGGEKDLVPPKILNMSPENKSTNLRTNEIAIHFDEYIQVENGSEIHFFPEIKPRPKIKVKGKSIIVELPSNLKLNTTHIINFNNSIVDLNESNPLKNFTYVFSTGGVIDTCELSGHVFDLKSNLKTNGAVIGLFQNKLIEKFDSLIRGSAPDYFIFSDEEGGYTFSNLKSGNYILYGFKDLNLSNKYEDPEPISMPLEIKIKPNQTINIPLFVENQFLKHDTLNCFYMKENKDSLGLGSINLNFKKEIYTNGKYIGELMLQDVSVFCFHINSSVTKIDSLLVGDYSFRMFEDVNKNNLWDSGNIKSLMKPEKLKFFSEVISVKKDWEIDVFIE